MIERLVDAISLKLSRAFPDHEIYTENTEHGLKEPCFLITLLQPTNEKFMNERYYRTHYFNIHFFPKSGRAEIYAAADKLALELEHIQDLDGETYEANDMSSSVVDGVLHFSVHYNFFIDQYRPTEVEMESVQTKSDVRGEAFDEENN